MDEQKIKRVEQRAAERDRDAEGTPAESYALESREDIDFLISALRKQNKRVEILVAELLRTVEAGSGLYPTAAAARAREVLAQVGVAVPNKPSRETLPLLKAIDEVQP